METSIFLPLLQCSFNQKAEEVFRKHPLGGPVSQENQVGSSSPRIGISCLHYMAIRMITGQEKARGRDLRGISTIGKCKYQMTPLPTWEIPNYGLVLVVHLAQQGFCSISALKEIVTT